MAEYVGLEIDDVPIPEPATSPVSAPHEHLSRPLGSVDVDDEFAAYQIRAAFRLVRHLDRLNQIGAEVVEQDREDVAALIGKAPKRWDECEDALESFVLADDGAHDDELVLLFNRRWRRNKALMGPPGSAINAHHTMQPIGPSLLS